MLQWRRIYLGYDVHQNGQLQYLPPPPQEEYVYADQPVYVFVGPDYGPPPPPPPPGFAAVEDDDWRRLPPPAPPVAIGVLPALTAAVPLLIGARAYRDAGRLEGRALPGASPPPPQAQNPPPPPPLPGGIKPRPVPPSPGPNAGPTPGKTLAQPSGKPPPSPMPSPGPTTPKPTAEGARRRRQSAVRVEAAQGAARADAGAEGGRGVHAELKPASPPTRSGPPPGKTERQACGKPGLPPCPR